MKYCTKSGHELHDEAIMCTGCGCMIASIPQQERATPSINTNKAVLLANVFNFIYSILGIITVSLFAWGLFIFFDEDILIVSGVISIGAFVAAVLGFIMTLISKPKINHIFKAITNLFGALSMLSITSYILVELLS